ncbi:hypothetical protein [Benzoatithermus flavus]|uniref:Uncharacterized protein n=1 Tax=Benzoatithermus flavus TaxID=3108223 RepID=A0ABU8XTA5_9PROT
MPHRQNHLLAGVAAGLIAAGLLLLAGPGSAQQGPRRLFPDIAPPPQERPVLPPASPAPLGPVPASPAQPDRIRVESLSPPTLAALGVASAEDVLGGAIWSQGAPPDLPLLLQRLPTNIAEPTLRGLQKAVLLAPGLDRGGSREIFFLRVDRLLAMGEPEAALELLGLVPESDRDPELEGKRVLARFAADQTDAACAAASAQQAATSPWPEARLVCAALARDAGAVETGLDLLEARGQKLDPLLTELLRAAPGDHRVTLPARVPDDPLFLPLLRRVPLDVDAAAVARLPAPVRQTLAVNKDVPAVARAAAGAPVRVGPSVRPELNGRAPADWRSAFASVPAERRGLWTALVDGLGLELPDAIWAELVRDPQKPEAAAPDLALWRGFEVARLQDQRGAMLLYVLLLLDGRPEAAAPVSVRRALDALVGMGLSSTAKALAAGAGGAAGL